VEVARDIFAFYRYFGSKALVLESISKVGGVSFVCSVEVLPIKYLLNRTDPVLCGLLKLSNLTCLLTTAV